jgi:hypothetical protein
MSLPHDGRGQCELQLRLRFLTEDGDFATLLALELGIDVEEGTWDVSDTVSLSSPYCWPRAEGPQVQCQGIRPCHASSLLSLSSSFESFP